jgi:hypothetical protein
VSPSNGPLSGYIAKQAARGNDATKATKAKRGAAIRLYWLGVNWVEGYVAATADNSPKMKGVLASIQNGVNKRHSTLTKAVTIFILVTSHHHIEGPRRLQADCGDSAVRYTR